MDDKPWDLRVGRWQDALADVDAVDAVIVDAPYSDRVHAGHDATTNGHQGRGRDSSIRLGIDFTYMTAADVAEFVTSWHPRCRGWFVSITDHELWPVWRDALDAAGRYVFAPIPLVETGGRVRLSGDGPAGCASPARARCRGRIGARFRARMSRPQSARQSLAASQWSPCAPSSATTPDRGISFAIRPRARALP